MTNTQCNDSINYKDNNGYNNNNNNKNYLIY